MSHKSYPRGRLIVATGLNQRNRGALQPREAHEQQRASGESNDFDVCSFNDHRGHLLRGGGSLWLPPRAHSRPGIREQGAEKRPGNSSR